MEFLISNIWIISLIPLLAAFFTFFFGKRLPGGGSYVTIISMAACFLMAVTAAAGLYLDPSRAFDFSFTWFTAAGSNLETGYLLDPLTAAMLVVVTLVSLLVQIYSTEYMHGDNGYTRYFSYLSIFTFAMLLLVISNNFLTMYIAWELVGLCSYLLIGFWFEKKSATNASKKAFITTKIGDVGFLIGMMMLYAKAGTFNFAQMYDAIRTGFDAGLISPVYLAIGLIALFFGAVGKSAQFPLHVWLPDAMEGPTPVSALIHAATMVAAGVYLVGRMFPLLLLSKAAMLFIAYTGAFTAIFAASIALVMTDIKKVLAYSTISQLGYMMVGLGVGGYVSGLFHLVTHAFFKALLFLGSGSVIHAMHTQEITEMGGLLKKMKITGITFLLGSLSIAGVPPFSGFFSKDAILADAFRLGYSEPIHFPIFAMAIGAAFMTAFYMFRLFFLTFLGETRKPDAHPHECGSAITIPLTILAILAVFTGMFMTKFDGFLKTPVWTVESSSLAAAGAGKAKLTHFKSAELKEIGIENKNIAIASTPRSSMAFESPKIPEHHQHLIHIGVMLLSIGVAFAGILLAALMYWPGGGLISPEIFISGTLDYILYTILASKYFFDEIYQFVFVDGAMMIARILFKIDQKIIDGTVNLVARVCMLTAAVKNWFDKYVVDMAVNGTGFVTSRIVGRGFSLMQSGFTQSYLIVIAAFMVFTLILTFKYKLF